jgi:hypothetical protein
VARLHPPKSAVGHWPHVMSSLFGETLAGSGTARAIQPSVAIARCRAHRAMYLYTAESPRARGASREPNLGWLVFTIFYTFVLLLPV